MVPAVSTAPRTLEGWFALHEMYAVDWPRWNGLGDGERAAAVEEASALLESQARAADGQTGCWSLLTQKGDLCLCHWRRDLESLRAAETAFARTALRAALRPTYSYLSVIELGTYELTGHAAGRLKTRGVEPTSSGWEAALEDEMKQIAAPRLFPKIPAGRYLCFYPMSKRRGEHVNWFDLPAEDR